MREGWELMKFSDLCELTRGHNPPKSKFINEPKKGYVRFYQIRDGWSDEYKVYVPKTPQLHTVLPDDMLMVAYRHIGKVFRGVTGAFNVALCKISNKSTEILDNDYLFYMIPSEIIRGELMKRSERSLIPSMSVVHLKSLQLPIPPLEEQKQIVAILDNAFAAIDQAKTNIEKNIENAKELFQSKLNDIFSQKGDGWEEKSLGEVCENLDSKRIPITKNKRIPGDIPYYGASGIVDYVADYLFDEDLLLVSEDGANLLARTYPIAFSISGKNWVNNHAHVLKFKNKTSQIFIEYYLNSIRLDDYVSGMAQPKLNQRMLNSIPVPFPSILIQEKVVSTVEKLNTKIKNITTQYEHKLINLEDLKKSILQKAFVGELTENAVAV